MKKFVATLLVLAMVLAMGSVAFAAKAKFTKADVGSYVKFTGTMYAYNNHKASSKSNVIVKKGSVAQIVGVYGKKWVKLALTEDGKKTKWFGVDKLKATSSDKQRVIFSSGGSGISTQNDITEEPLDAYANKKVKTTGKVNLRKTASLQGKSLGTVKKGKKVTLTGIVGKDSCGVFFFQVKYGKQKGFISEAYLKVSTAAADDALAGE